MSEFLMEKCEKGRIIRLQGRLDAITSPSIEKKLLQELQVEVSPLFLDFSKVNYLSSAGMRVLLVLKRFLEATKSLMVIFGVTVPILEILKIAGFDQVLMMVDLEEEALALA